jgi:hypothetical protein
VNGKYRKMLSKEFYETFRHLCRNLVETVFSVIRRKYREGVKARKNRSQVKEIRVRGVIYHIERWLHWEVCLS